MSTAHLASDPDPQPRAVGLRRGLGSREDALRACKLVAVDPAMTQVLDHIERVAFTQATVLLLGESGTGKELLARFLHACSPRRQRPFVALNCAAIPESLLESMLFGHHRGAFTGAHRAQAGKFEQADGGTLFLDEIGELASAAQAKLLRVLQERRIERLGEGRARDLDIRLVAATNVDLERAVREGRFREDLYYRLAVFPVQVPALRERPADIPVLAQHFTARYAAEFGLEPPRLDEALLATLLAHRWPGNVRELENVVQRALLMAGDGKPLSPDHLGLIQPADGTMARTGAGSVKLAGDAHAQAASAPRPLNVRDAEREHILRVLQEVKGDRRAALSILGISERALRYKLKAYRDAGWLGSMPADAAVPP